MSADATETVTDEVLKSAYTTALSHIRNVPVTDSSNETLRPFLTAYVAYKRSGNKGPDEEFSCHQDVLATYPAAKATLDALTMRPPVPTGRGPAPIPVAPVAEGTVQWIDIDLIDPHPMNPRIPHESEVSNSLAAQMERDGRASPNHPLVVRRIGARFQTLSGNTRLGSGMKARMRQMPVIVIKATDAEALVYLASANVQEPLSALEQGLHSIKAEEVGVTVRDYAARCGLQPPNLSRYRKGARVFLAVRDELDRYNVILLRDRAEHLAAIEKAPQEQWARLARLCVDEKWSLIETKRQVEAIVLGTREPCGVAVEEVEPLDPVIADDHDDKLVADDTTNGAEPDESPSESEPTETTEPPDDDEPEDDHAPGDGDGDGDQEPEDDDGDEEPDEDEDDDGDDAPEDEEPADVYIAKWRDHESFDAVRGALTAIASEAREVLHLLPNVTVMRALAQLHEMIDALGIEADRYDVSPKANALIELDEGARLVIEALTRLPPDSENPKADALRAEVRRFIISGRPTTEAWARQMCEKVERLVGTKKAAE